MISTTTCLLFQDVNKALEKIHGEHGIGARPLELTGHEYIIEIYSSKLLQVAFHGRIDSE